MTPSLCWVVHSLCPGGLPAPHSDQSWSVAHSQAHLTSFDFFFLSFVPSLPVSLSLSFLSLTGSHVGEASFKLSAPGCLHLPRGGAYRQAPHLASFLVWPLVAQLAAQHLHCVFLRPFILCSAGRGLFYTFFCLFVSKLYPLPTSLSP